ncbi:T-box-containing protein TBX6L-like isoform X2 [Hyperolius riggenbachi]
MILTKNGRRMFPEFSVSLSGVDPHCLYSLCVQAVPEGENRYKWRDGTWSMSGRAEPGPPTRLYLHPESPAPGHRWMERPVCFSKIRLTNNTLSQGGQIVLQSMHRYFLRLYVIPTSSAGPMTRHVTTVSFPETSFIAVTSYQNPRLSLLKIEENPFAKGIKYFKNQQENHTPKKRNFRPEQNEDCYSESKRPRGSADGPGSPASGNTEEAWPVSEQSTGNTPEQQESSEQSPRNTPEQQESSVQSAGNTPEKQQSSEQSMRNTPEKQDSSEESAEERSQTVSPWTPGASADEHAAADRSLPHGREEDPQRTDRTVQWQSPTQRTRWLPPTALSPLPVTPYTPPACLMGTRFAQSLHSGLAPYPPPMPPLPPIPPTTPYYLSSWTSPPLRMSYTHPGLHPQLFQQMCGPPWYLSPQLTSRGL